jgi:hypothetical protein
MAKKKKKLSGYSDYTLDALLEILGIDNTKVPLSLMKKAIEPSEWLKTTLSKNEVLPITSEKARSELLVTPVLVEWISNNPRKLQYIYQEQLLMWMKKKH